MNAWNCPTCGIGAHQFLASKKGPPLGWRCPVCGRGLAPDVKECSCVKAKRSGVLDDSLAWIYEDYEPPEA